MNQFYEYIKNLELFVQFNKKLTILGVCIGGIVPLVMFIIFTTAMKNRDETIWILTADGDVISAHAGKVKENRHLEAIAHSKMFVNTFFELDRFTVDKNIASAYDLGGTCIHALYQKMEADSWFSQIKQYNVRQSVIIDQAECLNAEIPYQIRILFRVQIVSEVSPEPSYTSMDIIFTVLESNGLRTKNNPHALLIEKISIESFNTIE